MSYRSRFDDPYPRSRGDERGGRSNDDGRGRPVEDRYRDYPPNSAPRRSRSPGMIFFKDLNNFPSIIVLFFPEQV